VTGRVDVVGLGPGDPRLTTPAAAEALAAADDLVGYAAYVARAPVVAGQARHASDNREEDARARAALEMAAEGRRVAVVCSGDPGVFAMAAAVCEAVEAGPPAWRDLDLGVTPGVTAMLAAAAAAGAPLGHDFCAINLSDNLKPWAVVERRLAAAAGAGFAVALYNPASRARPDQFARAMVALGAVLPGPTPVVLAHAVTTPAQRIEVLALADAPDAAADMRTLVIVGSTATRVVERPGRAPLVYSPRRWAE
jgi:precorrin-3B C17-methyltransferase